MSGPSFETVTVILTTTSSLKLTTPGSTSTSITKSHRGMTKTEPSSTLLVKTNSGVGVSVLEFTVIVLSVTFGCVETTKLTFPPDGILPILKLKPSPDSTVSKDESRTTRSSKCERTTVAFSAVSGPLFSTTTVHLTTAPLDELTTSLSGLIEMAKSQRGSISTESSSKLLE